MAKTEQLTFVQVLRESQPATWLPMVLLFSVGYWLSGIAFGWMWVVGVLYFTLPFNFMARWIIDGKSTDKNHGEYWIVLLAGNIPFWLYFWANGTRGAGIWLCLVVILAAVYEYGKRHTRHLPGIDILMAATMVVLPFTFGASQSSSTLPLWLPAAAILFLWASAGYLYRGLLQSQPQSTATLLGPEKVLMTCLAFYAVAAVLPSIFYGWYGLPVGILLIADFMYIAQLMPYRDKPHAPIFMRTGRAMLHLHRVIFLLLVIYLAALHMAL